MTDLDRGTDGYKPGLPARRASAVARTKGSPFPGFLALLKAATEVIASKFRRERRLRGRTAVLVAVLLLLPGVRSVAGATRACAMHRAPRLPCHEMQHPTGGGHAAPHDCCRKTQLAAAFCSCGHGREPARTSGDPWLPLPVSSPAVTLVAAAFEGVPAKTTLRSVDPPEPPPPIASASSLS